MHGIPQHAQLTAERLDHTLQSEAHAEDGDALFDQQIEGFADRKIGGPARPGRQHDEIGAEPLA